MGKIIKAKIVNFKWTMPIIFLTTIVLFIASIVLFVIRGGNGLEISWGFNIGIDVLGTGVCAIVCYSCVRDRKNRNDNMALFVSLLLANSFALFFDEVCWIVQGLENYRMINLIANALYYANGSVIIYLFWRYAINALDMEGDKIHLINMVLNILLIPSLILALVNIFYPIYFSVSDAGMYARSGKFYIFSYFYALIVVIAFVIELIKSKATKKQKAVVASFVTIPVINAGITAGFYGISTQYGSTLIALLLMYGVLFTDRGKNLAATEKELNVASSIQSSMLPRIFPPFPERKDFDIYASMTPAKEVGGDFYDFFLIDKDHLGLVIADVSGKGIPAALFMMATKILIKNHALSGMSPSQILEKANGQICANNQEEMFVTIWLGILDLKTGILKASNAGHEYPIIKRQNGLFTEYKDKHGFVVGGMSGIKYKEYSIKLGVGDIIFLYTDGVPEATNSDQELFGVGRMLDTLNSLNTRDPKEIILQLHEGVDKFVGDAPQFDDITMSCLVYNGLNKEVLEIDAINENLSQVVDFVSQRLEKYDVSMKIQMQIELAIEEIFVNICNYAYDGTVGKAKIEFSFDLDTGEAIISFIDNGKEYNPLEKEDPDITLSAEEREIGGLGIYMVKKSMDRLQYDYVDGCNIFTIYKKVIGE